MFRMFGRHGVAIAAGEGGVANHAEEMRQIKGVFIEGEFALQAMNRRTQAGHFESGVGELRLTGPDGAGCGEVDAEVAGEFAIAHESERVG